MRAGYLVRSRAREPLVFLAFLALTALMTWPWIARLGNATPDAGDPYLNSWILWWDFHQTLHDPLHLFDGNIFYPYRYSLALSEHNYGIALPLFPLLTAGLPPLTAHGVATLLGFALCGYGAFRLARTLTGSVGAGWIAGLGFAFVPYRFHQLSHVNYLSAGWIPLLLEALVLTIRKPSWKRAAWLGAAFTMNGLTCIHWLVLTPIPLAATAVFLLVRGEASRDRALVPRAAAALGVSALVLLPFLLPYQRAAALYGFTRTASEARAFSAHLVHWFTADTRMRVWHGLGETPPPNELCLFPGLLLLALPLAALLLAWRIERGAETLGVGLIWAGLGVAGSFGLNGPFHRALWDFVPLFRVIRVPARWAMVADLGLALLAGVGALALAGAIARRFPGFRLAPNVVFTLLAAALLFEQRAAPLPLIAGDAEPDAVTLRLKETPMRGGIVELPAGGPRGNYRYVLRAADHGKPLITAVSGFTTPIAQEIHDLTQARPVPDALMDLWERIPTSYVVVHDAWLEPEDRDALGPFLTRWLAAGRLRFVRRFGPPGRDDLYVVVKTEPETRAEAEPPWLAAEPPKAGGRMREDGSLSGSLDEPEEAAVIRGRLVVRGWARVPGEDLGVTVLLDGEARAPESSQRVERPDVAAALPGLGDTAGAGYELHYSFTPADDGPHEVQVTFTTRDRRARHYPVRRFVWKPGAPAQGQR